MDRLPIEDRTKLTEKQNKIMKALSHWIIDPVVRITTQKVLERREASLRDIYDDAKICSLDRIIKDLFERDGNQGEDAIRRIFND